MREEGQVVGDILTWTSSEWESEKTVLNRALESRSGEGDSCIEDEKRSGEKRVRTDGKGMLVLDEGAGRKPSEFFEGE